METKTEILSQKAANWWSNEIEQNAHNNFVQGLDDFEKQLANKIRDTVAINGVLRISSLSDNSNLLDKVALKTGMSASIPKGFEMRFYLGKYYVYDSKGKAVAEF